MVHRILLGCSVLTNRYMRAYFYEFTTTGHDEVDSILEAVALAGKAYHYTGDWVDAEEYGPDGYWGLIQQRCDDLAYHLKGLEK